MTKAAMGNRDGAFLIYIYIFIFYLRIDSFIETHYRCVIKQRHSAAAGGT